MAQRSEGCEFELRLQRAMEGGFMSLCLAMGLKAGLLEKLLQTEAPVSSSQLAERSSCKERYVHEWLSALVACDVVDVDVTGTLYHVTPAKARVLQDNFLAIDTFRVCACRLPAVTSFFALDGPPGMGFTEGYGFGEVMERGCQEMGDSCVEELLSGVPGLQQQLERGMDVAEFACGTGALLTRMAKRFPKSRFHGSDYDADSVEKTRRAASSKGLKNVDMAVVDLCHTPESLGDSFDWIYIHNALHDLPNPLEGLRGVRRALRKGAFGSVLDINVRSSPVKNRGSPQVAYMYVSGLMSCLPSALQQDPQALALGVAMGIDKGKQLVQEAGLTLIDCRPCSYSSMFCMYVFKK